MVDEGDKSSASDGLETADAGRLYATAYEHNAILCRLPVRTPIEAGPVLLRPAASS